MTKKHSTIVETTPVKILKNPAAQLSTETAATEQLEATFLSSTGTAQVFTLKYTTNADDSIEINLAEQEYCGSEEDLTSLDIEKLTLHAKNKTIIVTSPIPVKLKKLEVKARTFINQTPLVIKKGSFEVRDLLLNREHFQANQIDVKGSTHPIFKNLGVMTITKGNIACSQFDVHAPITASETLSVDNSGTADIRDKIICEEDFNYNGEGVVLIKEAAEVFAYRMATINTKKDLRVDGIVAAKLGISVKAKNKIKVSKYAELNAQQFQFLQSTHAIENQGHVAAFALNLKSEGVNNAAEIIGSDITLDTRHSSTAGTIIATDTLNSDSTTTNFATGSQTAALRTNIHAEKVLAAPASATTDPAIVYSQDATHLSAQHFVNGGIFVAKKELHSTVVNLLTNLENAVLTGEQKLAIICGDIIKNSGYIESAKEISIAAQTVLDNLVTGTIISQQDLKLISGMLIQNAGAIVAETTTLTAVSGHIHNLMSGVIAGNQSLTARADTFTNEGAIHSVNRVLIDIRRLIENSGTIHSDILVSLICGAIIQNTGTITSANELRMKAERIFQLSQNASIMANQLLAMIGEFVVNNAGIISGKDVEIAMNELDGLLTNLEGALIQSQQGSLTVTASQVSNRGAVLAEQSPSTLNATKKIENNSTGFVQTDDQLTLNTPQFNNQGTVSARELILNVTILLENETGAVLSSEYKLAALCAEIIRNAGKIQSKHALTLAAKNTINNLISGQIISAADTSIITAALIENAGLIGADSLELQGQIDNLISGTISATTTGAVTASPAVNNAGTIQSPQGSFTLRDVANFNNLATGIINIERLLDIAATEGVNAGIVRAEDASLAFTNNFTNTGDLQTKNGLSMSAYGQLLLLAEGKINVGGALTALGYLRLYSAGDVQAYNTLSLLGTLLEQTGGTIQSKLDDVLIEIPRLMLDGRMDAAHHLIITTQNLRLGEHSHLSASEKIDLDLGGQSVNFDSDGPHFHPRKDFSIHTKGNVANNKSFNVPNDFELHARNGVNKGILGAGGQFKSRWNYFDNPTGTIAGGQLIEIATQNGVHNGRLENHRIEVKTQRPKRFKSIGHSRHGRPAFYNSGYETVTTYNDLPGPNGAQFISGGPIVLSADAGNGLNEGIISAGKGKSVFTFQAGEWRSRAGEVRINGDLELHGTAVSEMLYKVAQAFQYRHKAQAQEVTRTTETSLQPVFDINGSLGLHGNLTHIGHDLNVKGGLRQYSGGIKGEPVVAGDKWTITETHVHKKRHFGKKSSVYVDTTTTDHHEIKRIFSANLHIGGDFIGTDPNANYVINGGTIGGMLDLQFASFTIPYLGNGSLLSIPHQSLYTLNVHGNTRLVGGTMYIAGAMHTRRHALVDVDRIILEQQTFQQYVDYKVGKKGKFTIKRGVTTAVDGTGSFTAGSMDMTTGSYDQTGGSVGTTGGGSSISGDFNFHVKGNMNARPLEGSEAIHFQRTSIAPTFTAPKIFAARDFNGQVDRDATFTGINLSAARDLALIVEGNLKTEAIIRYYDAVISEKRGTFSSSKHTAILPVVVGNSIVAGRSTKLVSNNKNVQLENTNIVVAGQLVDPSSHPSRLVIEAPKGNIEITCVMPQEYHCMKRRGFSGLSFSTQTVTVKRVMVCPSRFIVIGDVEMTAGDTILLEAVQGTATGDAHLQAPHIIHKGAQESVTTKTSSKSFGVSFFGSSALEKILSHETAQEVIKKLMEEERFVSAINRLKNIEGEAQKVYAALDTFLAGYRLASMAYAGSLDETIGMFTDSLGLTRLNGETNVRAFDPTFKFNFTTSHSKSTETNVVSTNLTFGGIAHWEGDVIRLIDGTEISATDILVDAKKLLEISGAKETSSYTSTSVGGSLGIGACSGTFVEAGANFSTVNHRKTTHRSAGLHATNKLVVNAAEIQRSNASFTGSSVTLNANKITQNDQVDSETFSAKSGSISTHATGMVSGMYSQNKHSNVGGKKEKSSFMVDVALLREAFETGQKISEDISKHFTASEKPRVDSDDRQRRILEKDTSIDDDKQRKATAGSSAEVPDEDPDMEVNFKRDGIQKRIHKSDSNQESNELNGSLVKKRSLLPELNSLLINSKSNQDARADLKTQQKRLKVMVPMIKKGVSTEYDIFSVTHSFGDEDLSVDNKFSCKSFIGPQGISAQLKETISDWNIYGHRLSAAKGSWGYFSFKVNGPSLIIAGSISMNEGVYYKAIAIAGSTTIAVESQPFCILNTKITPSVLGEIGLGYGYLQGIVNGKNPINQKNRLSYIHARGRHMYFGINKGIDYEMDHPDCNGINFGLPPFEGNSYTDMLSSVSFEFNPSAPPVLGKMLTPLVTQVQAFGGIRDGLYDGIRAVYDLVTHPIDALMPIYQLANDVAILGAENTPETRLTLASYMGMAADYVPLVERYSVQYHEADKRMASLRETFKQASVYDVSRVLTGCFTPGITSLVAPLAAMSVARRTSRFFTLGIFKEPKLHSPYAASFVNENSKFPTGYFSKYTSEHVLNSAGSNRYHYAISKNGELSFAPTEINTGFYSSPQAFFQSGAKNRVKVEPGDLIGKEHVVDYGTLTIQNPTGFDPRISVWNSKGGNRDAARYVFEREGFPPLFHDEPFVNGNKLKP